MNWFGFLFGRPPRYAPDARVPVLVNELKRAALTLDTAADAMKHQRITPHLTTRTKTAARHIEEVLVHLGLVPEPEPDEAA